MPGNRCHRLASTGTIAAWLSSDRMYDSPRVLPHSIVSRTVSIDKLDLPNHIAFGIQQPWAELILRGLKTIEVRRLPVRPGGPIYLYASRKLSKKPYAIEAAHRAGLDVSTLPLGVLVGTIHIAECRQTLPEDVSAAWVPAEFLDGMKAWVIESADRLESPQPIHHPPYGMWFYPFAPRETNKHSLDR